eukprot:comp11644_c0_seq1/m.6148 comp11644_c0_seq1/g.6148  ORF comp11644_c0_seq1/g.6148 comp11644_c0_seq1/m.6148 type:complete len:573 (-) comp11644_c0_seq1:269-1987(-)
MSDTEEGLEVKEEEVAESEEGPKKRGKSGKDGPKVKRQRTEKVIQNGENSRSKIGTGGDGEGGEEETENGMTWLKAAALVLSEAGEEGMHYRDVIKAIAGRNLATWNHKTSLDTLLYRETGKLSDRFIRLKDKPGFFKVPTAEEAAELRVKKEARRKEKLLEKNMKREKVLRKYYFMKKDVKRALYFNSALRDEVAFAREEVETLHAEKRYLLARLVRHEPLDLPAASADPQPGPLKGWAPLPQKPRPVHNQQEDSSEDEDTGRKRKPSVSQGDDPPKKRQKKVTDSRPRPPTKVPVAEYDADGNIVLPWRIGSLTIHNFGTVTDKEGYHTEKFIFPIGFMSTRIHTSWKNPATKTTYTCTVSEGAHGPLFTISAEDDPNNVAEGSSATAAHITVLNRIRLAKKGQEDPKMTGAGPLFFGFSTISSVIESLPGADRLRPRTAKAHHTADEDDFKAPTAKQPKESRKEPKQPRPPRHDRVDMPKKKASVKNVKPLQPKNPADTWSDVEPKIEQEISVQPECKAQPPTKGEKKPTPLQLLQGIGLKKEEKGPPPTKGNLKINKLKKQRVLLRPT